MSADPASLFWKDRTKFDKFVSKLYSKTGASNDEEEDSEEERRKKKEKKKAKKEK